MKEPNYKELFELAEKKIKIIKEQMKVVLKYANKDIYEFKGGKK